MKLAIVASASLLLIVSAAFASEQFGQPLTGKPAVTLAQLKAKPEAYVGKEFQVKGKVTEVCQMMGCWVMLTDGNGAALRYQADEHVVSFPKTKSVGRMATVEGKLAKYELTKEQAVAEAKHAAEDAGRKFDPASVKGPQVIYQIEGNSAELD